MIGASEMAGVTAGWYAGETMAWTEPLHSPQEVNWAGKKLVKAVTSTELPLWTPAQWAEWDRALLIIDNWRAAHGYPLNTFQVNLRHSARRVDDAPLIAQRTKRLWSITTKLARLPKMKMTQMQDVGGCRAVVKNVDAVRELETFYIKRSSIKHELASVDDYVHAPPKSGYRGVHLVYRYFSDKRQIYNGMKIELQLRSPYMHAWATAVETVGTFVKEALKSSVGSDDWLRFFALMGTAIAMREGTQAVPNTPTNRRELVAELRRYAAGLNVENRLRAYGMALKTFEQKTGSEAQFYLLKLDPDENELTVTGFKMTEFEEAQRQYAEAEREAKNKPGTDAVLVSVDSLAALPRAYPNYFADTRAFVELMKQALSGHKRRIQPRPLSLG